MTNGHIPAGLSPIEKEIVGRLVDEHKMLQDKIDKIGAFRFTIKGWCVTLIVAAIFAGKAFAVVSHWLWFSAAAVLLASFFLYEKEQTDLRYRFGKRSMDIEGVISRLLRKPAEAEESEAAAAFISLHFIPGISHYLRNRKFTPRAKSTRWNKFTRNWNEFKKRVKPYQEADLFFYIFLLAITAVFAFANSNKPEAQSSGIVVINSNENSAPEDAPVKPGQQPTNKQTLHKNEKAPKKAKH
jgi:hypothetical protein